MREFLEEKRLIRPGEFLVAIELFIGENHGGEVKPPYIDVLVFSKKDFDTTAAALNATADPLSLRRINVDLHLNEFLGLFKRFAVTLSARGLNLTGQEYNEA